LIIDNFKTVEVFRLDTVAKRLYEGLFLVDSGEAASDWDGINEMIRRIIERGRGEILSMRKWDERHLAYNIQGKDRGTYILVYFNADPSVISGIERDIRLSERIMRALVLRGDRISPEDMKKETPAMRQETAPETVEPAEKAQPAEAAAEKTTDVEAKESQN
jgi:small subunit ribosomal protein S6